ncbi:MAG: hypothetical protein LBQ19_03020, partial [Synergistaceae bacterium]|nr:hypothetical protein [Synergistaceae bacterium]
MFSYKKSAFAAALLLLLSIIAPAYAESQARLGSPDGWRSGELRSVTLDTVSGNQGYWLERDYRTATGVSFKATLIGGKGVAARFTTRQGGSSDGVLGSGGVYKTFMIGEFPALS